jgi:hypothetical protein
VGCLVGLREVLHQFGETLVILTYYYCNTRLAILSVSNSMRISRQSATLLLLLLLVIGLCAGVQ